MREILPPMEAAQKICGPAKVGPGPYRWTHHCLRVPCEDGVLLYHTLTGALLLLPEGEAEADEELIRRRFLVPEGFDEWTYAQQYRSIARLMAPPKPGITAFTVFTTMDCNARCFYCYELGRPRTPMTAQVARDAAAYMARVSDGRKVKLTWFGGEPLYNAEAIDGITDELRARGVAFRSRMVSNGYLFDEDTVRRAKDRWALDGVQITLDGTEETYNRTKAFIYRDGSAYRRVLGNMERLLDAGIRVNVRLNADRENLKDLSALVDQLADRFRGRDKLVVYSVLLRDFGPAGRHPEWDADLLRDWDALQQRILDSGIGGIRRLLRNPQVNNCMADSDNCVTILPDGRLGKCEHESEQLLVGSVYDGVTDGDMVARWKERIEVPACRTCPFSANCIRLRLCSWSGDGCTEADRAQIALSVVHSVLNEYRLYKMGKAEKGEKTDESEADVDFSGFGR